MREVVGRACAPLPTLPGLMRYFDSACAHSPETAVSRLVAVVVEVARPAARRRPCGRAAREWPRTSARPPLGEFTVMRTISDPACASSFTCIGGGDRVGRIRVGHRLHDAPEPSPPTVHHAFEPQTHREPGASRRRDAGLAGDRHAVDGLEGHGSRQSLDGEAARCSRTVTRLQVERLAAGPSTASRLDGVADGRRENGRASRWAGVRPRPRPRVLRCTHHLDRWHPCTSTHVSTLALKDSAMRSERRLVQRLGRLRAAGSMATGGWASLHQRACATVAPEAGFGGCRRRGRLTRRGTRHRERRRAQEQLLAGGQGRGWRVVYQHQRAERDQGHEPTVPRTSRDAMPARAQRLARSRVVACRGDPVHDRARGRRELRVQDRR